MDNAPGNVSGITGGRHDFDFLMGDWMVRNRRLVERGTGCTDWDEFEATSAVRPQLGGLANVDEITFPTKGFAGLTIRSFDLATSQWSIWWVNSTVGRLDPPVLGGFDGDHGVFVGDDRDDERPVRVRFDWTKLGPDAARWEQSFAYDEGSWAVWERNWVMDFTRR